METVHGKGTHAYVKRTSFKEVRIHLAENQKSFVPVFVPRWTGDAPICQQSITPNIAPVGCIRLGQVVTLKRATGPKNPPGKYRVASTMQANVKLIPIHIQNDKDALKAAGYLENGVNISWDTFIKAAGYELPHPSSAQSESAGATEA